MWQLAFEIDREADDQNDYLDNMVRNEHFSCLLISYYLLMIDPLLSGLQLPECDRSADRQREAFFHHGAVWEGQPPYSLLRVHGAGPGLLPGLLPDLQDTAVTSAAHICCTETFILLNREETCEESIGRSYLLRLADDAWTYELFVSANLVHVSCYHTNISKETVVSLTGWRIGVAPAGVWHGCWRGSFICMFIDPVFVMTTWWKIRFLSWDVKCWEAFIFLSSHSSCNKGLKRLHKKLKIISIIYFSMMAVCEIFSKNYNKLMQMILFLFCSYYYYYHNMTLKLLKC